MICLNRSREEYIGDMLGCCCWLHISLEIGLVKLSEGGGRVGGKRGVPKKYRIVVKIFISPQLEVIAP